MKKELLEYLVRACAKEVLTQVNETRQYRDSELKAHKKTSTRRIHEEDTKGAPAPPADGLGSAEQPPIPKSKDSTPEDPSQSETPDVPPSVDMKGVVLVNPRDKSKLQKVPLPTDDATIERSLHRLASTFAGSKVKIALSTMRSAKETAKNPNSALYLYLGKYDPNSDEIFLMADKSLQVAKDSSIPASDMSGGYIDYSNPSNKAGVNPDGSQPEEDDAFIQSVPKMYGAQGREVVPDDDSEFNDNNVSEDLKSIIKKMVNEILSRK